jgi:DNA-binding MarR family transcriptional regulator
MVTPEQAGERFLAVFHRMHRAADERMSACGLSMARTKVLRHLAVTGPVRPGTLASVCGVVPHSITDIVDGLERDGLAERQPDPADRRAKLISLTAKGATALTTAAATREQLLNQLFGALDETERQQLHDLLDRLDNALTRLPDTALTSLSGSGPANASPVSKGTASHVIA